MRIPEAAKASHMNQKIENFIIVGVTREGKKFRPSDWSDRLCGVMSAFGADHRMTYSPYVRPGCTLKGDKTVLVDARLYDVEPLAYKFMVNFANDNNLQIEWMGDTPLKHPTRTRATGGPRKQLMHLQRHL